MSHKQLPTNPFRAECHDFAYNEAGYRYRGKLFSIDEVEKLYVEERGFGPDLLCISGLGGDSGSYINLVDSLCADFRMITYDRRGASRSTRGWNLTSIDQHADDAAKVIDLLTSEKAYVFASSLGAAIALKLILKYPEKISGLILHETWIPTLVSDPEKVRRDITRDLERVVSSRDKDCGYIEARARYFFGNEAFEYGGTELRGRVFGSYETHTFERNFISPWSPSEADLQNLKLLPITIFCGKNTHYFFDEASANLGKHLNLQVNACPGGHGSYLDYADEMATMIKKTFLGDSQPGQIGGDLCP